VGTIRLYDRLIASAERAVSRPAWRAKVALLAFALSLYTAWPPYAELRAGSFHEDWDAVLAQCAHPLTPQTHDPASHSAKIAFRLTVPALAYVLRLGLPGLLVLQHLALFGLFCYAALLAERATNDRVTAWFATLGLALTFPGNVLCSDLAGFFDGVAYALLLAAMFHRGRLAVFALCLAAAFVDERGFLATGLVFLWHWTDRRLAAAVALAGATYLAARFVLGHFCGLHTPTSGTNLLPEQAHRLPFALWTAMEGFWLPVLFAAWLALKGGQWLRTLPYLAASAVLAAIALSVIDITRSMGYLLPVVFVGLRELAHSRPLLSLRRLVLSAALISLVPTCFASGQRTIVFPPLPWVLARSWSPDQPEAPARDAQ
jgi:hypothetical protein